MQVNPKERRNRKLPDHRRSKPKSRSEFGSQCAKAVISIAGTLVPEKTASSMRHRVERDMMISNDAPARSGSSSRECKHALPSSSSLFNAERHGFVRHDLPIQCGWL
ncbi:uncharacterized protein RCC_04046 [Ramularia collo-cygni]|uniref:Uncharacterized protein n=1 Tax=Ramularia collo-cygni TaxID=112498 RepID=A0A2D3VCH0_9PEZI|nr:uncharacterized protein RCC_04046 [Ramularia collo-cygni]CZT18203.1 uncharacterized protein RCC_04046 [Ramularia collo-cygni]